jgi:formylglycine-generating enzyme required for sulfatase activity
MLCVYLPGVIVGVAIAGLAGNAAPAEEIPGWPFDAKAAARDQAAAAQQLGVPVERELVLGDGVKLQLILVPSGRFRMGSPMTEVGRESGKCAPENQHEVILTRPFYIGKTEVSQEQFQALMGVNPCKKQGAKLPVETVTWEQSVEFCTKLGEVAKSVCRLPTEAEWEWACRAGSGGAHCLGDDPSLLDRVAWYNKNSMNMPHPVGEKEPNAWGIHDMHGNVMEWVHDAWVRPRPYPDGPLTDPKGADQGHKIRRGAHYSQGPEQVRSAHRHYGTSLHTGNQMGFRAAMEIPPQPSRGE